MTDMTDFDAELKRAFALAEEPRDEGFAQAVTGRVSVMESRRRIGRGVQSVLMALAGAAGAFGLWQAASAIGPGLMAAAGPDLAMLFTAQLPAVSIGMPLLMAMGAIAGAGAVWLRRTAE